VSVGVLEQTGGALRAARQGDVLLVTFAGLYTQLAHIQTCRVVIRHAKERPTRAVVLDLRLAVNVMSDAQRRAAVMVDAEEAVRPHFPVAIVVSHAMFGAVSAQCAMMREQLHLWRPFLLLENALEWASSRPRPPH